MKYELENLASHYPVLVIGGGVVGAGIFWDLSLHGVNTLIVDRGDFASQTSQRSSKMLHGGIRYLENLDFHLVFEALHEKNLWRDILPEICYETSFLLPIYKSSKHNMLMTRMGLFTYDFLSSFQNSPHQILSAQQTLQRNRFLKAEGLKGGGIYHDVIVDDAKLTLEVIFDGLSKNQHSAASNYIAVTQIQRNADKLLTVTLEDQLTKKHRTITTEEIVCATGPFTDQFLQKINLFPWKEVLLPSKGIHIWLDKSKLNITTPTVLQTKDERILFVIPHKDAILVGTTESETQEDFFNIEATQAEIDYILENLNFYFTTDISQQDVIASFAGIRPLAKDDSTSLNRGKTSREHKIFNPLVNFHVIVGGKLTTFRVMGQQISRSIVERQGKSYSTMKTTKRFTPHSTFLKGPSKLPTQQEIQQIIDRELVRTVDDLVTRRLGIYSPAHWKISDDYDNFKNYLRRSFSLC